MAVRLTMHLGENDEVNNLTLASAILDLIKDCNDRNLSAEVVSNMMTYQIRHLELPKRLKERMEEK